MNDEKLILGMMNDACNMLKSQQDKVDNGELHYDAAIYFLETAIRRFEIYCMINNI